MNRLLAVGALVALAIHGFAPAQVLEPRYRAPRPGPPSISRALSAFRGAAPPRPAVARIIVPESDGTSYGSGTLVDTRGDHGLVITNWHVVHAAAGPIEVVFPGGFRSQAHVHKLDEDWDLAALAVWRPPVEPVKIATVAPRPQDLLTIAGYGGGEYREQSGRCVQYLAPGENMPYEIIELKAAARQGDSGGPILNERGELAGVLFGEGRGRTCGSHCLRVREFLATVLAGSPSSDASFVMSGSGAGRTAADRQNGQESLSESTLPMAQASTGVQRLPSIGGLPAEAPAMGPLAGGLPLEPTHDPGGVYALEDAAVLSALVPSQPYNHIESSTDHAQAVSHKRPSPWLNQKSFEIGRNVLAVIGVLLLGRMAAALLQRKPR